MNSNHRHLKRLDEIWSRKPIYFVTTCTFHRQPLIANPEFHQIAIEVWKNCERHTGWRVGRFVIMPDHVHFFAVDVGEFRTLSRFVGSWKQWTSKEASRRLGFDPPLWQPEFFDRLLRTSDSYDQKWDYVRQNPVRAGLVEDQTLWDYQGDLGTIEFD